MSEIETIEILIPGQKGDYTDIIYKDSATQPATPTGNSPAGWVHGVPDSVNVWQSNARKTNAGALVGVWSTPQRIVPAITAISGGDAESWAV